MKTHHVRHGGHVPTRNVLIERRRPAEHPRGIPHVGHVPPRKVLIERGAVHEHPVGDGRRGEVPSGNIPVERLGPEEGVELIPHFGGVPPRQILVEVLHHEEEAGQAGHVGGVPGGYVSVLGDGGLFVGRPGVDGEADGLVVDGEGLGQYRPCAAVAAAAVLVALGHPDANSNGNGRRREQTKGYEGLPRTDEEAEHIPLVDLGGRLDGHLGALLGEGAGDRQAAGVLRVGGGGGMGGGGRSDALLDVAVAHLLLPSELRGRHVGRGRSDGVGSGQARRLARVAGGGRWGGGVGRGGRSSSSSSSTAPPALFDCR